ncbi:MAG: hypothetical protein Q8N18_22610 [Opitutaceae bacterium]|nr:hypothetical protein [Opitutaceae bacterium]
MNLPSLSFASSIRPVRCVAFVSALLVLVATRAAAAAAPEAASISADAAVQKELAELERVLNANSKLEETLRINIDQLMSQSFRAQNPDVDALLKKQPGLANALKVDQQFLLRRAIARLARVKVTRPDALALDQFLKDHPDIRKALQKSPGQIVDAQFLIANPALARFMETHPALSSVLLKKQDDLAKKGAPTKK